MARKRIAVLFGGCSTEHAVSLESAFAVLQAMDRQKHEPVALGITEAGEWRLYSGDLMRIKDGSWQSTQECAPAIISPDRQTHGLLVLTAGQLQQMRIDAALPMLHGRYGEDGTVQGLLELAGIPVIGCGTLSSALCMDKHKAHQLASLAGVTVPRSQLLTRQVSAAEAAVMAQGLGYPLFVKPVRSGSSIGLSKVTGASQLPAAIELAFSHDQQVLLEENIEGFEVGCAVLGDEQLIIGELDEVDLNGADFDFTEKYTLTTAAIYVPARIPAEQAAAIKQVAITIYRALGCSGFARVDMFLQPDGGIVMNEVNTIPGFTDHSRFPSMMRAIGLSLGQVIDIAIEATVS